MFLANLMMGMVERLVEVTPGMPSWAGLREPMSTVRKKHMGRQLT